MTRRSADPPFKIAQGNANSGSSTPQSVTWQNVAVSEPASAVSGDAVTLVTRVSGAND